MIWHVKFGLIYQMFISLNFSDHQGDIFTLRFTNLRGLWREIWIEMSAKVCLQFDICVAFISQVTSKNWTVRHHGLRAASALQCEWDASFVLGEGPPHCWAWSFVNFSFFKKFFKFFYCCTSTVACISPLPFPIPQPSPPSTFDPIPLWFWSSVL